MLTAQDMKEYVAKRPFEPFRIRMSDGESLDVRHPDMCIVGRNTVFVGLPDPREQQLAVRIAQCSIVHITRIEPLDGKWAKPPRGRRNRT